MLEAECLAFVKNEPLRYYPIINIRDSHRNLSRFPCQSWQIQLAGDLDIPVYVIPASRAAARINRTTKAPV